MQRSREFPESGRLSILVATILLAYAIIPFVNIPSGQFNITFTGIIFNLPINFATIVSFVAAAMAVVGTDWLLQTHPGYSGRTRITHLFLPGLTAWVIGVPLSRLQVGLGWWVVFGLGGALLVLVFISEYIAIDLQDIRILPAGIALTALSFALYLVLTVAIKGASLRLYLVLAALTPTMFLVALRTLYLRLNGKWCWSWAIGLSLVIAQLGLGLHYLPLSPLRYGLILTGLAYSFTSLAGSFVEKRTGRGLWLDPVVTSGIFLIATVLLPI
jgi:hypothetical protein